MLTWQPQLFDSWSGNLSLSSGPPRCLVMFWLLIHAHKALSVRWNVIHQSAALLYSGGSLQVFEDEQSQAGFEWSCCCCNSNSAELHLPAQNLFSMEIKFTQQDPCLLYDWFPGAAVYKDPAPN